MKIKDSLIRILSGVGFVFFMIASFFGNSLAFSTESKLTASDAAGADRFGESVSISGDITLVGARYNDDAGTDSGSAYVYRYDGSIWVEEQKLLASDAAADDQFGISVSISGDVALVGAYLNDDMGTDSGSAYVYRYDGTNWVEEQKLLASDAAADDRFGSSVSISEGVVLVGAPENDDAGTDSGSAYVYRYDGTIWVEEQKLLASDAAADDRFGESVSISEGVVLVGAYLNDDMGTDSGSAYVFHYDGTIWVEEQKLLASDAAAANSFGSSVSISGNVVLVGAPENDDAGTDSGSAYVFHKEGTWVEKAKPVASDAATQDIFGYSVSISGNVALVGAPENDDPGSLSGSAYVYRNNGTSWLEEQKLVASDAAAYDFFGWSVSISGDVALVGAPENDDAGTDSGSAYVYRYDGTAWVEETKLTAIDAAAYDFFGWSVSISGDVALVGAWGNDEVGEFSGSAYVFRYDGTSWVEEQKFVASDAATFDLFGRSVSISGDVALVGAWGNDDAGSLSGSAYVYRYNGTSWLEEQKLMASDAAAADIFGSSVSISGDVALVGAFGNDDAGSLSGSAYVYRYNGTSWLEEQKLMASDAAAADLFGISASITGNVALVGAYENDDAGTDSGSAYVYRYNGTSWLEEQKLVANDAAAADSFGWSASISGDVALVGAHGNDDAGSSSGSAYVFTIGHALTITKAGTGDGRVTSAPVGIDCDVDCIEPYDTGTMVTLTASRDGTSTFDGWSGDCTGTGTCVVTMDGPKSVTATFTRLTLDVIKAGTGTGTVTSTPGGINCGEDCTEIYPYGTEVILTATPDGGIEFSGWSGDSDCADGIVTMDARLSCTATFDLNFYTLNVALAGTGTGTVTSTPVGINCGGDCTEIYQFSTVVDLTPTPGAGSGFNGWSGDLDCLDGTVIMDVNKNCTAKFDIFNFDIPFGGIVGGETVSSTSYQILSGSSSEGVGSSTQSTNYQIRAGFAAKVAEE